MKVGAGRTGWMLLGWLGSGCVATGDEAVALYGTLYDGVPEVIYLDAAGLDGHRLGEATLDVYDLRDLAAYEASTAEPLPPLRLTSATFYDEPAGDFVIEDPALVPGVDVTLVAAAPGHSPTAFTGEVPVVAPSSGWFRFFDGALFSEPEAALRARVEALAPSSPEAWPDPSRPGQGALIYGQLLSDPHRSGADGPKPLAEASVTVRLLPEGRGATELDASYLAEDLSVDPALTSTSTAGVFYLAGVPEGPVEVIVTPADGEPRAAFRTLAVEDGMTWLAAFYVEGVAP